MTTPHPISYLMPASSHSAVRINNNVTITRSLVVRAAVWCISNNSSSSSSSSRSISSSSSSSRSSSRSSRSANPLLPISYSSYLCCHNRISVTHTSLRPTFLEFPAFLLPLLDSFSPSHIFPHPIYLLFHLWSLSCKPAANISFKIKLKIEAILLSCNCLIFQIPCFKFLK